MQLIRTAYVPRFDTPFESVIAQDVQPSTVAADWKNSYHYRLKPSTVSYHYVTDTGERVAI